MEILVCVKQVPDMESKFNIDTSGTWYDETDLAYRMNEYDEFAVEQAVLVKEKLRGDTSVADTSVTVLSIGPERVKDVIKKALSMGCDRGVHIKDEQYQARDPMENASIIASFAKDKGFDLIFTGLQSQDRGSAQTGIIVARVLEMRCVTTVVGFELENDVITAKRELDGGLKAGFRTRTPAVITCQMGLNKPRYPTLPNIIKAKKKELTTIEADTMATAERMVETDALFHPEKKGAGLVLEGEINDQADKLISILREKTGVIK